MTAAPASPPASAALDTPRASTVRDRGTVRLDSIRARRWSVSGTAKVVRDVEVDELRARGLLSVGGRLAVGSLDGRGAIEVEGPLEARGPVTFSGPVHAARAHVGSLDVRGIVRIADGPLVVEGEGAVRGTLEAPEVAAQVLRLEGAARIPGATRVSNLHADLRETSTFGPIVGRSIWLHGKVPNLVDKVLFHECLVTVGRIEADVVDLEGVDVDFVRSPEIVLGRSCHVTRYEGTIVRQHASSAVGPESRTPPPYGLRR